MCRLRRSNSRERGVVTRGHSRARLGRLLGCRPEPGAPNARPVIRVRRTAPHDVTEHRLSGACELGAGAVAATLTVRSFMTVLLSSAWAGDA
jgi:hypothetical protein